MEDNITARLTDCSANARPSSPRFPARRLTRLLAGYNIRMDPGSSQGMMRPYPAKYNLPANLRHKRRQPYVPFTLLISFLSASSPALPAGFSAHDASEGVYTIPQAERGKKLFDGACRLCHSDDPNFGGFGVPAPGTHSEPGTRRGLWLGDDRPVMGGLVGERGLAR